MSNARDHEERSPWAAWQRRLSRERALLALFDSEYERGFARWATRWYALIVFVSYAASIWLVRGNHRTTLIHGFVRSALVSLSWVVGALAALAAARILARSTAPSGDALTTLALTRGHSPRSLLRARALSAAVRIARLVGLPGVLLVGVGLARGAAFAWALAVAPAIVVYAGVLGLGLALLALLSAELAPRRPRALLVCLLLGPLLLAEAEPGFPSPIGLFSALLAHLLNSGAWLT